MFLILAMFFSTFNHNINLLKTLQILINMLHYYFVAFKGRSNEIFEPQIFFIIRNSLSHW